MNRLEWAKAWRENAGIPSGPMDHSGVASVNDLVIVTWINSEGSQAKNNPLDTTEPWPNATDYNSAGVKNYQNVTDGLDATTRTLYNGYYKTLISVLKNPTTAENGISAIYWSPWGSKPTLAMLNAVRSNWSAYASVYVAGTPNTPLPPTGDKKMWLIALTASGLGYWKVKTTDGSVYAYGDAQYKDGINNVGPNGGTAMVPGDYVTDLDGHSNDGYVMVTNQGNTYAFGSAKFEG